MRYFLAKTDPDTYSIDQFERERRTIWDGVTNAQAVRAIKDMVPGDRVFIYHSGDEAAVLGLAQVTGEPRPDPNNARSWVVEVEFLRRLKTPVTLKEIKESGRFASWALVRQGRLSTMSAPDEFVHWVTERQPGQNI